NAVAGEPTSMAVARDHPRYRASAACRIILGSLGAAALNASDIAMFATSFDLRHRLRDPLALCTASRRRPSFSASVPIRWRFASNPCADLTAFRCGARALG